MRNIVGIATYILSITAETVAASAAEFEVSSWRERPVIRMSGIIGEGDAAKARDIIYGVPAFPHGLPIMLLDSLGGSVSEALKISEIMDEKPIHTVVPDGARCASACASVIFIAGALRTVDHFGLLGQHSCSQKGIASQVCNELLSQHAIENGVSHGSVSAFVTYVPPEDILWFTRSDADGWGLTRYAGEREGGFEKSEPRVMKMLTGNAPRAQSAWRIDFRENGYEAFLRPAGDDERELELNVFCSETKIGRLFLSVEVHGSQQAISEAVESVNVNLDTFGWNDRSPEIHRLDSLVSEVVTEVPSEKIVNFLTEADRVSLVVSLERPYKPIVVNTFLASSRKNLVFAANHCAEGIFKQ